MRLTFLGTSAGLPTTERNVSALALAMDNSRRWYLTDCGEGTQQQLMHCQYTLSQLQAIFITHVHGDHTFGLPGLITSASMQGRQAPLVICAPEGVESFVRHTLKCTDSCDLPFELCFRRSDEAGFTYCDDTISVTSHPLSHRVPSFAYRFTETPPQPQLDTKKLQILSVPQGPLWGQLQQGKPVVLENGQRIAPEQVIAARPKPRVVVIGGDNDRPELLDAILPDTDLLVHEATFTHDILQKVGPNWMHSTARVVALAAAKANLPHIILTHFSGRFRLSAKPDEKSVELLRQEAQQFYQGQVELAEDFAVWELSRRGVLQQVNAT